MGAPRSKPPGQSERYGFSSVLEQTSPCNDPKPSSAIPRGPKPQHAEARPRPQRDDRQAETNPEPNHSSHMIATERNVSAPSHVEHADGSDDTKSQPDQHSEETEETDELPSDDAPDLTVALATMSPAKGTIDDEAVAVTAPQSSENSIDAPAAIAPAMARPAGSAAALPSSEARQASTPGLSKLQAQHAAASSLQSPRLTTLHSLRRRKRSLPPLIGARGKP